MPNLASICMQRVKQNIKDWEAYKETEEDKKIYDIKYKKMKGLKCMGVKVGGGGKPSVSDSESSNSSVNEESSEQISSK